MALESVVFQSDPYNLVPTEFNSLFFQSWDDDFSRNQTGDLVFSTNDTLSNPMFQIKQRPPAFPQPLSPLGETSSELQSDAKARRMRPKKRKRASIVKEDTIAAQRMVHIAVERKRRKTMNQHLSVLRSIMPPSYVQRGDQASIVAGAINFVKELEHTLQLLQAHKSLYTTPQSSTTRVGSYSDFVFSEFFIFPQYTSASPGVADVEVAMVESHVRIRVLSKRRSRQLLKMLVGLNALGLTTLHLNLTTAKNIVLHSFSVKVEEDCQLATVNEIADATYQMVRKIQEEDDQLPLDY